MFSESRIKDLLGRSDLALTVYSECDSTNLRAIEYARENGTHDAVFLADSQTAGRGRLGRSFLSPAGRGIYLSILTARLPRGEDAVSVTAYAAVAVCRAIERLTSLSPVIKWVNDIYVGGRKVAGILAQGIVAPGSNELSGVVMGVGINVLGKELDPEIDAIATTLEREGDAPDRERLVTEIISRLWSYCPILCGKHRIIKNYRDNLTPRLTLSSSRADLCLLPAALQPSQITLIQSVIKAIGSWASGPAAASLFPIHSYWSRVWGRLTVPLPFWHAPNFDA